jgi:hypothetical protein
MPDEFPTSKLKSFSKAKDTPLPVRVLGGVRAVYLKSERVRVVDGKNINGTRSSSRPPAVSPPPGRDPAPGS